jgi:nucleotide-binding universal stress UspA family protein
MVSEPMGPVVVGVDGSLASLAALDLAAEEAAARVTPLLVVHVHPGGEVHPEQLRETLAVAVERARAEHPILAIGAELADGDPATVLLSRGMSGSLLVVGHRGRYRPGSLTLGSVALKVIDHAPVPVIVHRPVDDPDVPSPRPVLVGVAADQPSDPVVEFAFMEAALRGAPLHAMYVWSDPAAASFPQAQAAATRMLGDALSAWSSKYPEVAVHQIVRHSLDPAVAITAASRVAQLVVVGSAHPNAASRILAGSVGHALVHRAGCPVAVVNVD